MIVTAPCQLAQAFKVMRKKRGLTQQEVAELAGIKQKSVSAFENGKLDVRVTTLFRLLAAVGLVADLQDDRKGNNK